MRAVRLGLLDGDRERLTAWTRSSTVRAGLAQRARIVLLAADGVSHTEIADRLGVSRQTVITWRGRYEQRGLAGLDDAPRSGRPRTIDHDRIVTATLTPPPKRLADNPLIHAPDHGVLAQPRRGLVRHHRPPGHPPRHLRLGQGPQRQGPRLIDG